MAGDWFGGVMAKWFSLGDLNDAKFDGKTVPVILKLVISDPSIGDVNSAKFFADGCGYKTIFSWNIKKNNSYFCENSYVAQNWEKFEY